MHNNDFLIFDSLLARSSVYAHPINLLLKLSSNLFKGIYENINFPVIFKVNMGNKINDIIDTGLVSSYLISEKLKTTLKDNHLTGWETFPIVFLDRNDHEIHGYHGFAVTGKCGFINHESAKIIETVLPKSGRIVKHYKGITVDNWDGSDFFSPKGTSHIFISKKGALALRKNNTTNLMLTKSDDYTLDAYTYQDYLEHQAANKAAEALESQKNIPKEL